MRRAQPKHLKELWLNCLISSRLKNRKRNKKGRMKTFRISYRLETIITNRMWWFTWNPALRSLRQGDQGLSCHPQIKKQINPAEVFIVRWSLGVREKSRGRPQQRNLPLRNGTGGTRQSLRNQRVVWRVYPQSLSNSHTKIHTTLSVTSFKSNRELSGGVVWWGD